ncbi:MAG: hypothetical protein Q8N39_06015 [Pelolinea sp.]|nr:hypothetical protein [Pelolinea sp.]
MKTNETALAIPDLKTKFSNRKFIRKVELKQFYLLQDPDLTEQAFRRILYSLEKQKIIIPIGAGVYALLNALLSVEKKKFIPTLSPRIQELSSIIRENFPYTHYLIWETNILNEFMTHQPSQNLIILEIDKDACESVFNRLKEQTSGIIFLEPDKLTFERYIINTPESIILLRLVTQSPKIKAKGITTARLEKILVDIFTDEDRFFAFHGQELTNIFENAFSTYWINLKTLFRYAGRRKVAMKMQAFITTQTQIELSSPTGNIE